VLIPIERDQLLRIGISGLAEPSEAAEAHKKHAIELVDRLREERDSFADRNKQLLAERDSLEKGIFKFPQDVVDLKEAINARLRTIAKGDNYVRIVAEVAEIKNDRWRNVIEGYLHNQKYYIIVPEEYFSEALKVFDAIKRQKAVYTTGIVDIDRLKKLNSIANSGSLAEELETNDMAVRLFLDYTLGRVQKCDNVQELRNNRIAVTDEGMLYQNFVVRAMNPERWAKPAIGQDGVRKRLEAVILEIDHLAEQMAVCANAVRSLDAISKLVTLSSTEIEQCVSSAKDSLAIPNLEVDLFSLRENRDALDTTKADLLRKRISALDESIVVQDNKLRSETKESGSISENRRRLHEEIIPRLTQELVVMRASIQSDYEEKWIESIGETRYTKELMTRGNADSIATAFPRQLSLSKNRKESVWEVLCDYRRNYNELYKTGYDVKNTDNLVYYEALTELSSNELPLYQQRILDAESKAYEQFQEDFLGRMYNNIHGVEQQIDDLNKAIKGIPFGEDSYRFRCKPKPEHRRFYDMIMDAMFLTGGYNLLSSQFNDKYKEEIADLFAIITNTGDGAGGSSESEKRILEYTDFRTYLSFDLEVLKKDGEEERLYKTLSKKSGGETQTPF